MKQNNNKNSAASKNTSHNHQRGSIKEFYRKVLLLQEEEKKRISRDLHDESGQIVIALGTFLNVIEKELNNKHIDKALAIIDKKRELLKEIATKMKFMAFNLRPPALDILGLPAVLREYFSQYSSSSLLRIEFKENLKDKKLGENIEITLYRIIQEAMNNISKHANAKAVKVELLLSGKILSLFVEDDGKGFDSNKYEARFNSRKMGLRGIKERVDILSGKFIINSRTGKGTKLTVELPLGK